MSVIRPASSMMMSKSPPVSAVARCFATDRSLLFVTTRFPTLLTGRSRSTRHCFDSVWADRSLQEHSGNGLIDSIPAPLGELDEQCPCRENRYSPGRPELRDVGSRAIGAAFVTLPGSSLRVSSTAGWASGPPTMSRSLAMTPGRRAYLQHQGPAIAGLKGVLASRSQSALLAQCRGPAAPGRSHGRRGNAM